MVFEEEREKKLLRKERTRLRTLSGAILSQHFLDLSDDDVEGLCISLDIEQLRNLCDKMERKEVLGRAELLREALGSDNKAKHMKHNEKKNEQQNGSMGVNDQVIFGSNEQRENP
ncbi:unnamed protein product [Fraxinus pennsylvanica]|uniref:Uncharacterized protein n=1 Tax=Fraxinus pennsylvanica TaxID=56036 RepID=A0AAD1Z720_9LAMI|nr:unnamed protein product [Fraxinus pennsylvanica]